MIPTDPKSIDKLRCSLRVTFALLGAFPCSSNNGELYTAILYIPYHQTVGGLEGILIV